MVIYGILFYIFALLMIVASCGVTLSRNPVYSVFFLIFAFFNAAGLFVLLGAEFLAATLIIVYVGAIAVLFLFVVMMLNIKNETMKEFLQNNFKTILFLCVILLIDLIFVVYSTDKFDEHILSAGDNPKSMIQNTEQIGLLLYTKFVLPFELSGLLLFIAMISAIVLTHRNIKTSKKQNISRQLSRNKGNALKIVKSIKVGQGVDPIIK
ncbi:MAG: NADH-quinone oxidoreductase subunit J [Rickettsiales bacterium]